MKIAVIYNRESKKVINLFGVPNQEKYGLKAIRRIVDSLKRGGHQAIALEGDKDLIENLEDFMPRALKGERPGMAFNLSYGIQGQARYTHVPGILEMVGVPYVGSGPLAHSLALDKVVAKMLFVQNGIPTPAFAVLESSDFEMPELEFPLIVKPKNEALSMGIRIVNNEAELREAAGAIFTEYAQPVLVEQYIDGKEINVGLLGNGATLEAFPPAELEFGEDGPKIYTIEDKRHKSGRTVTVACPAAIDEAAASRAQEIAAKAFKVLACYDCARVDLRMDDDGNIYVLELNSLPSLGEHGSYVAAAQTVGLDFPGLINRLVDVAAARYFGTPNPPQLQRQTKDPGQAAFAFLTERRDRIERRIASWMSISSRSGDAVGQGAAARELEHVFREIGLRPRDDSASEHRPTLLWESSAGLRDGTLLVAHLDVPVTPNLATEHYQRTPEWLFGEGIGSSRAPLTMLEYSLRALRHVRRLSRKRLGVLVYSDEGQDCRHSADALRSAFGEAGQVLVLTPGNVGDSVITGRRGQRRYILQAEGTPLRLGQSGRKKELMQVLYQKLNDLTNLSDRKKRTAVSAVDVRTEGFPMRLPHRAQVTIQVSYPDLIQAGVIEREMRRILRGGGIQWDLALLSDRPPMANRSDDDPLTTRLQGIAEKWDIPLERDTSLWPSVAGLVPEATPVLCGLGPVTQNLYTSKEAVSRMSLVQRTLLLTEFLLEA